jgi:hypothetical protein
LYAPASHHDSDHNLIVSPTHDVMLNGFEDLAKIIFKRTARGNHVVITDDPYEA